MPGPESLQDRREKRFQLPILASVSFLLLLAGQQYYGWSSVPGEAWEISHPIPTVAVAWARMAVPPGEMDDRSIVARDTIALIYPFPGPGVESCTVVFASLPGVPFTLEFFPFLPEDWGHLHSGSVVFAYFSYSEWREAWYLAYAGESGLLY